MNLPRAGPSQPKGRIRPAGRKMPRSAINGVCFSRVRRKFRAAKCSTANFLAAKIPRTNNRVAVKRYFCIMRCNVYSLDVFSYSFSLRPMLMT